MKRHKTLVGLVILSLISLSGGAAQAEVPNSNVRVMATKKIAITSNFALAFSDLQKTVIKAPKISVTPKTAKLTYQWLKDGRAVKGAVSTSYKFLASNAESRFQLKISASAPGYAPATSLSAGFVPGDQPKVYKLLWSDEFDTAAQTTPAKEYWVPQDGDGTAYNLPGWGNNEEQFYRSSQSAIKDGVLTINATRTGASAEKCYYGACQWLSSKFVTKDKLGFQYGRMEARVKSSTGEGVWPAFWLLGANIDTRSWPGCGEIDVMELKGQEPNKVWGTIHGPNGSIGEVGMLDSSGIAGWHTYAIDWTPTSISWFIDGKRFNKVSKAEYVGAQDPRVWVFDHEFYLILNLAMGGNFVGGPSDPALTSAQTEFDYVRYYSADGLGNVTKH
jgi:beta-glucanase (GH16 family)